MPMSRHTPARCGDDDVVRHEVEILRLVYLLYGLTEEEIKIAEGKEQE